MNFEGTIKETLPDNIARSSVRTFIGVEASWRGRPLPNPSRAFRWRTDGKSLLATVLFHKGRSDPPSNPMNLKVILIHLITAAGVYTYTYAKCRRWCCIVFVDRWVGMVVYTPTPCESLGIFIYFFIRARVLFYVSTKLYSLVHTKTVF